MRTLLFAVLLFGMASPAVAQDAHPLVGTWKLDLRPTPDAEPYYQNFVVTADEDGALAATFYSTPVENFHLNDDWGALRFAFTTGDGSGVYHTTGVIEGDTIRGTTHALGRGFLSVWSGERTKEDGE